MTLCFPRENHIIFKCINKGTCDLYSLFKKAFYFQRHYIPTMKEYNNISVKGSLKFEVTKSHCFLTHVTLISCISETTKGGGKSVHFLKALLKTNSEISVSRLKEYSKYSALKFCISRCYTNSLKMNVFSYLSLGVTELLSVGLSDQYNTFL